MKADLTEPSGLLVEAGDGYLPWLLVIPVPFLLKWMSGLILYGMLCFGFNCPKSSEEQVKLLSLECLPGCPVKT